MHFIHGRFINFWSSLLILQKTGIILLRHHYSALINCKIAEWEKLQWADIFFSLLFVVVVVGCFSFFFCFAFSNRICPKPFGFRVQIFMDYCNCGGVFEQLAGYTMRYQESNLHLGLYSSLTSANSPNSSQFYLFSVTSQIAAVFITKFRHLWVSWSDRGNNIKVNAAWVMIWYNWTYMVVIDKKLQTNEKLKRLSTNPNRNFKGTNEPRSALKGLPMEN